MNLSFYAIRNISYCTTSICDHEPFTLKLMYWTRTEMQGNAQYIANI